MGPLRGRREPVGYKPLLRNKNERTHLTDKMGSLKSKRINAYTPARGQGEDPATEQEGLFCDTPAAGGSNLHGFRHSRACPHHHDTGATPTRRSWDCACERANTVDKRDGNEGPLLGLGGQRLALVVLHLSCTLEVRLWAARAGEGTGRGEGEGEERHTWRFFWSVLLPMMSQGFSNPAARSYANWASAKSVHETILYDIKIINKNKH